MAILGNIIKGVINLTDTLTSEPNHIENQEKLKLEGELRTAVLKSELSAIKAQLNPHFLYNVFNTISASVPAENEKTRKMNTTRRTNISNCNWLQAILVLYCPCSQNWMRMTSSSQLMH